jgi:hypothetical protein
LYYHRSQIVHPPASQQVVFLILLPAGSSGQGHLQRGYSWWRRGRLHSVSVIGPGADGDVSVRYYWSGGARWYIVLPARAVLYRHALPPGAV